MASPWTNLSHQLICPKSWIENRQMSHLNFIPEARNDYSSKDNINLQKTSWISLGNDCDHIIMQLESSMLVLFFNKLQTYLLKMAQWLVTNTFENLLLYSHLGWNHTKTFFLRWHFRRILASSPYLVFLWAKLDNCTISQQCHYMAVTVLVPLSIRHLDE